VWFHWSKYRYVSLAIERVAQMRVAVVGAGLQAKRRAPAVIRAGDELAVICAAHEETARRLAAQFGCQHDTEWKRAVSRNDVDTVIVCTPPGNHAAVSIEAIKSGKSVLCEKPLARTSTEAIAMMAAAKNAKVSLKCGFNIRYHPAVSEAKRLADAGTLGELFYIKATFGIGARPGYEAEWRVNPQYTSGGQLMEQGIHLVDLSRWFLGDFSHATATTANYFVKTKPFEDNAFVTLRTHEGKVAFLHASLTQWRNKFSFEITGSQGYATVSGMGGSYGVETLATGKNLPGAPFSETVTEFRGEDKCWDEEWKDFKAHIDAPSYFEYGLDGVRALQAVEAAYESSKKGQTEILRL
jgi:predicted dehydrogenase